VYCHPGTCCPTVPARENADKPMLPFRLGSAAPKERRPSRAALLRCQHAAFQLTRSQVSASSAGCGAGRWSFKLWQHPERPKRSLLSLQQHQGRWKRLLCPCLCRPPSLQEGTRREARAGKLSQQVQGLFGWDSVKRLTDPAAYQSPGSLSCSQE